MLGGGALSRKYGMFWQLYVEASMSLGIVEKKIYSQKASYTIKGLIKSPGAKLSETILRVGAYSRGFI